MTGGAGQVDFLNVLILDLTKQNGAIAFSLA